MKNIINKLILGVSTLAIAHSSFGAHKAEAAGGTTESKPGTTEWAVRNADKARKELLQQGAGNKLQVCSGLKNLAVENTALGSQLYAKCQAGEIVPVFTDQELADRAAKLGINGLVAQSRNMGLRK